VLVSNNPYAVDRPLARGTRPALDSGQLGIVVLDGPGDTPQPPGRAWSAPHLEVSAPASVHAGIDGEAVDLSPPLRFAIRPAALRVQISSRHAGTSPPARLSRRGRLRAPPALLPQATGAVTAGVVETFAGLGGGETAGTCALFFVAGLMSIGFGVVLFAHPNLGALPSRCCLQRADASSAVLRVSRSAPSLSRRQPSVGSSRWSPS
jgi:hypothetical protein